MQHSMAQHDVPLFTLSSCTLSFFSNSAHGVASSPLQLLQICLYTMALAQILEILLILPESDLSYIILLLM